VKDFLL